MHLLGLVLRFPHFLPLLLILFFEFLLHFVSFLLSLNLWQTRSILLILLVLLFLELLELTLVLFVLLLKRLHLLHLVLPGLLVFFEGHLQLGVLVLPHAEVFHQVFDLDLVFFAVSDLVKHLTLLVVLVLELLDALKQIPLFGFSVTQLLFQLLNVVLLYQLIVLLLQLLDLLLVVFDLLLNVLDLLVAHPEEVVNILLLRALLLGHCHLLQVGLLDGFLYDTVQFLDFVSKFLVDLLQLFDLSTGGKLV